MPKRTDIRKILIIGSGPIIIGQACEFDYSGTQACKALRKLGYEIVLVNSNPATIMTDPQTADATYIEPLNVDRLEQIIAQEKPDALLPNLGGQSGLNLCSALDKAGVLKKYNVEVIGIQVDAIERGEDRIAFKEAMQRVGIEMARSAPAYTVEEALSIADGLGYPVVVRPAYTMGGAGGGLVYNVDELKAVASRGLAASMIHQVLIEESILGWEELELEVVRDQAGNKITVCFIENIDPMGVHTGDSFCSAPMLTVPADIQARLQEYSYRILEEVQVVGGCNCQFAYDPATGRIVVIEINPRTSRSSALASKATGFPIALISAMLATGITLDEIPYWKGGSLLDYTPGGDYVVVKFARWAFEKFKDSEDKLGTQMKAVGEVMSIGKTYKEALHKAIRSLETGRYGLGYARSYHHMTRAQLLGLLAFPTSERQFIIYEAIRKGATVDEIHKLTSIHKYFLHQTRELVAEEEAMLSYKGHELPGGLLRRAKQNGFSDRYLARVLNIPEETLRRRRESLGIVERWEAIPVSGVENACYYYSTYSEPKKGKAAAAPAESAAGSRGKVMILGGGPNRIGQGIEFDYCCVHAALALRELGFETIMVNCNPETVSTDYDTSDRLYFEPLTAEDVLAIYAQEKPLGVIAQFGGQTPLNLARQLEAAGVRILGTSPEKIDLAEDRDRFRQMMDELDIPMPQSEMAVTAEEALAAAGRIGYPLMVRPSYVLGGRGMEVVHDAAELTRYMQAAVGVTRDRPILVDRFLEHALECEADAVSDGEAVFVPAVMEHVELAGIHSGDSTAILPSIGISDEHLATIRDYTARIARALRVHGLMNMQYAIADGKVYVLEANPRASRTVPLVSKVCGIQMVPLATRIIVGEFTGEKPDFSALEGLTVSHFGVKDSVFPFNMFPEVDPVLGPEMRSTGEVLGLADSVAVAFYKSQEAIQLPLPLSGTAFISVNDRDKAEIIEVARTLSDSGFTILATGGTADYLEGNGVACTRAKKLQEGRPNVVDAITNGKVDLVINTPIGKESLDDDSYIRKAAIKQKVPYFTTAALAKVSALAIRAVKAGETGSVKSIQRYQQGLLG